jgi:Hemerythrin HHE cation binding domain
MDITHLILEDHAEQRRLFALIAEIPPENSGALRAVWNRLRALLDTHALAEERFFYPELLKMGRGADSKSPLEETRDAIKDHNEIRDAAKKVDDEQPGSSEWLAALAAANHANSDHMAEEERQGLADFRGAADLAVRDRLGVKFLQFRSEHLMGVAAVDQNPDAYVRANS